MKKIRVYIPFLILTIFLLSSCSKPDKTSSDKETKKDSANNKPVNINVNDTNKKIYGYYVGDFEAVKYNTQKDFVYFNRITISLDSIRGDKFYGHSVVAGNNRPFAGSYKSSKGIYTVEVAEPGDDKYDGKFSFIVNPDSNSVSGTWIANNPALDVSERKYDLKKRAFVYSPDSTLPEDVGWAQLYEKNPAYFDKAETLTGDVLKYNASKKLLAKSDIENMHKGDLEILRNSIYARHGYSFKTRKIRFIFDSYVPWYMPVSTDVRNELTEVETKNIELLKRYEEHAEKYYDEYGR